MKAENAWKFDTTSVLSANQRSVAATSGPGRADVGSSEFMLTSSEKHDPATRDASQSPLGLIIMWLTEITRG
jgi:hypothetical protein